MFKRILIAGFGCAAALTASPVSAQIVGEWQYQAFADFPSSFRVTRDRADPRKMTAVGDLGGHLVVFEGTFVNLTWSGNWYWWGDGATPPPGIYNCRNVSFGPVGGPGPSRRTGTYGAFEFRLNAAETAMTGWWATKCRNTAENARVPGKVSFSASRMNTITAAAPPSVPYTGGAVTNTPHTGGTRPVPLGEEPMDDGPCSGRARVKLSPSGTASVPDTVFSARYRLRPCLTSAARSVQIDFLHPEGKRPMRLRLEGLRMHQAIGSPPDQTVMVSPTGAVYQQGLRFIGEPRAGQVMGNIMLAGRICAAPFWLAWLDFSDGTRSSEPIGILASACGIDLHRDMIPRPAPGSDSGGPRPVGKVRIKGG